MDLPENNKSSKSKTTWIVVGVVAALVVLGISIYAILMAMPKKAAPEQVNTPAKSQVTTEQLRLGLDEFNKTIEQEKIDRKSAQQALDDNINRIKLSN